MVSEVDELFGDPYYPALVNGIHQGCAEHDLIFSVFPARARRPLRRADAADRPAVRRRCHPDRRPPKRPADRGCAAEASAWWSSATPTTTPASPASTSRTSEEARGRRPPGRARPAPHRLRRPAPRVPVRRRPPRGVPRRTEVAGLAADGRRAARAAHGRGRLRGDAGGCWQSCRRGLRRNRHDGRGCLRRAVRARSTVPTTSRSSASTGCHGGRAGPGADHGRAARGRRRPHRRQLLGATKQPRSAVLPTTLRVGASCGDDQNHDTNAPGGRRRARRR